MPKKQSTAAKKARALAAAESITYSEALRRVGVQDGPRVDIARLAPAPRAGAFTVTIGTASQTLHSVRSLAGHLEWLGWEPVAGQDLEAAANSGGEVALVRSEHGVLLDQQQEIWDRAGLGFTDSAEPYATAVVAAIEAAGGRVAEWDVQPDEDRRIYITLGDDEGPGAEDEVDRRRWVLGWIDLSRGWFSFLEAEHGEALGSCDRDLECAFLAVPEEVAAAAQHLWGGSAPALPGLGAPSYEWTPPADYVEYPEVTGEAGDVILDLERSLAAYATHPAWRALQTGVKEASR